MQAKSQFALFIIVSLTVITTIIGYTYETKESWQQTDDVVKIEYKSITKDKIKKVEIETDKESDTGKAAKPVSLGEFKLTAYCPCSVCCDEWATNRPNGIVYGAIGEELKEGYSIAVDPDVIPYRTEVIINGNAYKAQDCGSGIKDNEIDVYFNNHNDALKFGVQYAEVFLVK